VRARVRGLRRREVFLIDGDADARSPGEGGGVKLAYCFSGSSGRGEAGYRCGWGCRIAMRDFEDASFRVRNTGADIVDQSSSIGSVIVHRRLFHKEFLFMVRQDYDC